MKRDPRVNICKQTFTARLLILKPTVETYVPDQGERTGWREKDAEAEVLLKFCQLRAMR